MSLTEINIVKSLNTSYTYVNKVYNIISLLCSIVVTTVLLIILDRRLFFIFLLISTIIIVLILKTVLKRERPYKR